MISYLAASVTFALALLGIFFSKGGKANNLTIVGYVILTLTIVSGSFSIYDVYSKEASAEIQRANMRRMQKETRRINNLLIATVAGINRKFGMVTLWMNIESLDDSMVRSRVKYLGRPLRDDEFVPAKISNAFISGLVSKSDKGEVVTITGNYLNYEMSFKIRPLDKNRFSVQQKIENVTRSYLCNNMCGDDVQPSSESLPLSQRNVIVTDEINAESNFGLELADGSSVGKVISEIEKINRPFLTLTATFTKEAEYEKFHRILAAATFRFKFYRANIASPNKECYLALFVPVHTLIKNNPESLTTAVKLSGVESVDIDPCEEPR